jgi:hypothetical protein
MSIAGDCVEEHYAGIMKQINREAGVVALQLVKLMDMMTPSDPALECIKVIAASMTEISRLARGGA